MSSKNACIVTDRFWNGKINKIYKVVIYFFYFLFIYLFIIIIIIIYLFIFANVNTRIPNQPYLPMLPHSLSIYNYC
jgi:hypothetical protein